MRITTTTDRRFTNGRLFAPQLLVVRIVLSCFLLFGWYTAAQEYKLCFEEFEIEDGFASVNAILKDKDGFMWFGGTQGLYRYDGYGFKIFIADEINDRSLSNNNVICLFEDNDGFIWVGTMHGGVNRYNPVDESFTNYKNIKSPIFDKNYITTIAQDNEGLLWIGTFGDGLYTYDPKKEIHQKFETNRDTQNSISNNDIFSVVTMDDGIWISSNAGILDKYNKKSGEFRHYRYSELVYQSARSGQRLCKDYKNTIWIGTEEEGVFYFDPKSESFEHFGEERGKPSISTNTITDIMEGSPGEIWMTTGEGLNLLNSNTGQISVYRNDSYDQCSITNNIAYSLFIDESNSIWIGLGNGTVNKTINSPFEIYQTSFLKEANSLSSNIIGSLSIKGDMLWIGTGGGGLNKLNTRTGKITTYTNNPDNPNSIPSDIVMTLLVDNTNTIWTGNSRENLLAFMKNESGIFEEPKFLVKTKKTTKYNLVFDLAKDSQDHIWIATYNDGLYRFDKLKKSYTTYKAGDEQGNLISNKLLSLFMDSDNKLWIGTLDKGIQIFDLNTEQFELLNDIPENIPINDYPIKDIIEANDGSIWIASEGGGLFIYDPKTGIWSKLTLNEGLPTNSIYGIVQDDIGNFWFSSNKGLINYNLKNEKILLYNTNDGLPTNDFEAGAIAKADDGKLYFGSKKGLVAFYPHQLITPAAPQNLKLVNLRIFNKIIEANARIENYVPLDSSILHTKILKLPYYLDNFTFEFAVPGYPSPHTIEYSYKLEGLEERWIKTSSERHFASYSNVPPGSYKFKVRASKETGSDTGFVEKELSIVVTPVWWQTKWAYLCYVLLLLGLSFYIYRGIMNRIRLKNQLFLEKISHEKDEELHRSKVNFFTAISHELRTSLTLVLTPLAELGKTKEVNNRVQSLVMTMNRNGQRLLSLVNRILDFRKLESGTAVLSISQVDLKEFFQETFLPFEQYAQQKDLRFKVSFSKNCSEGWIDPDKLEIIVYNLISNAFKFAEKEVNVAVSVKDGDEMLIIKVKDDGKGISQENLDRIFDNFYQIESKNVGTGVGTGLGLAITKNFVRMHKGTIEVESKVNLFTQFTVTVPIRKSLYREEDIRPPIIRKVPEVDVQMKKQISQAVSTEMPILLIVEDNIEIRNIVQDSFTNDYNVYVASNGQEGYEKAIEVIPDIIISDIMMPVLNGLELCEKLKTDQRTSHIPIVLLTARSSNTFKMGGFEHGADDYVTKPFDIDLLKIRVENLIGLRRMLREKFHKEVLLKPKDVAINNVDEVFLEKIMSLIENNMSNTKYSVSILARDIGMSHSVLYRKIMALSGQNINDFIKSMRLKRAQQLLHDSDYTIAEISDLTGFSNPKYFSTCFRQEYGNTPSKYRLVNKS